MNGQNNQTDTLRPPPAVAAVVDALEATAYTVRIRRLKSGSLSYLVPNNGREKNGRQLVAFYDRVMKRRDKFVRDTMEVSNGH